MRIRIDKIYGNYYNPVFNKHVLIARVYVNGRSHYRKLFLGYKEDMDTIKEGTWMDY